MNFSQSPEQINEDKLQLEKILADIKDLQSKLASAKSAQGNETSADSNQISSIKTQLSLLEQKKYQLTSEVHLPFYHLAAVRLGLDF